MKLRRFWRLLRAGVDPAESGLVDQPVPPYALPANKLRLHLFGADFDSAAEAEAFCYGTGTPGTPEPLTVELEGAFINTEEVEVVHGRIVARLLEFLDEREADDVMLRLAGDNTLIMITEDAFGGLPYALDDTETLTYLGAQIVNI